MNDNRQGQHQGGTPLVVVPPAVANPNPNQDPVLTAMATYAAKTHAQISNHVLTQLTVIDGDSEVCRQLIQLLKDYVRDNFQGMDNGKVKTDRRARINKLLAVIDVHRICKSDYPLQLEIRRQSLDKFAYGTLKWSNLKGKIKDLSTEINKGSVHVNEGNLVSDNIRLQQENTTLQDELSSLQAKVRMQAQQTNILAQQIANLNQLMGVPPQRSASHRGVDPGTISGIPFFK